MENEESCFLGILKSSVFHLAVWMSLLLSIVLALGILFSGCQAIRDCLCPYVMTDPEIKADSSAGEKYGITFDFINLSGKDVKSIKIAACWNAGSNDGLPDFKECVFEGTVQAGENIPVFIPIDDFEADEVEIENLQIYASEIIYFDGSAWKDEYGRKVL